MESKLVIDKPKNCSECTLCIDYPDVDWDYMRYCAVNMDHGWLSNPDDEILPECPLKDND